MLDKIYGRIIDALDRRLHPTAQAADYIALMKRLDTPVDDLFYRPESWEDGIDRKVYPLRHIFALMEKDTGLKAYEKLDKCARNSFMHAALKSHDVLERYDSRKEKTDERLNLLAALGLEDILLEKHDASDLYPVLDPLLLKRAKDAESRSDLDVAIAANERMFSMYAGLEETPEISLKKGNAASHIARLYHERNRDEDDRAKAVFYRGYELQRFLGLKGIKDEKKRREHVTYASHSLGMDASSSIPAADDIWINVNSILGGIYRKNFPKKALSYYREAIGLLEKKHRLDSEDALTLAKDYSNIGGIYYKNSDLFDDGLKLALLNKDVAVSIMKTIDVIDKNMKEYLLLCDLMTMANISHKMGFDYMDRYYTLEAIKVGDSLFSSGSSFGEMYACRPNAEETYGIAKKRVTSWIENGKIPPMPGFTVRGSNDSHPLCTN